MELGGHFRYFNDAYLSTGSLVARQIDMRVHREHPSEETDVIGGQTREVIQWSLGSMCRST